MNILVEISPAELIDKLTILEIKLELIEDESKRANVKREYSLLISAYQATIVETEPLRELTSMLKRINRELWDIEDNIRAEERAKSFGARIHRACTFGLPHERPAGGGQAPDQRDAEQPDPRREELCRLLIIRSRLLTNAVPCNAAWRPNRRRISTARATVRSISPAPLSLSRQGRLMHDRSG